MSEPQTRPPVFVVAYGDPGTEKSTLFASAPKPMLLLSADPWNKTAPYQRRGDLDPQVYEGAQGQPVRLVKSKRDPEATLVQIELYLETDPDNPTAWLALKDRMASVRAEVFEGRWASLVLESVTLVEIVCRNYHRNHPLSPLKNTREPRQIFGACTDDLERLLVMQLASLSSMCNVFVAAHVDTDKDEVAGKFVHTPSLPGRLRNRKQLASVCSEVYHSYAVHDSKTGVVTNWLQTHTDERFHATSSFLRAPNPCKPDFEALWQNWQP
jgi:hypothetical protein